MQISFKYVRFAELNAGLKYIQCCLIYTNTHGRDSYEWKCSSILRDERGKRDKKHKESLIFKWKKILTSKMLTNTVKFYSVRHQANFGKGYASASIVFKRKVTKCNDRTRIAWQQAFVRIVLNSYIHMHCLTAFILFSQAVEIVRTLVFVINTK